jgi:hypothetical protein
MAAAYWVKAMGVALHATEAALAASAARAWAPGRRWGPVLALASGALVACSPPLVFGAVSGMEVPLEGALLMGALLASTRSRWTLAGALAGIAAVTRPEGTLAIVAVAALALASRSWGGVARSTGAGLVPVGWLVARNLRVSGKPLPATFYVKVNPGVGSLFSLLKRGLVEALGAMSPASHVLFWVGVALAIALGIAALGWHRSAPALARRATATGIAAALGLLYAGGISALMFFEDPWSFYYRRYIAPPLVPLSVASVVAAGWLASAIVRRASLGRRPSFAGLRAKAMLAAPVVLALAGVGEEMTAWKGARNTLEMDTSIIDDQQVQIGRWIDAHLRPDAVVWTVDAGAIRYWGQRSTVDLVRLNTPELFTGPALPEAWWPAAIAVIPPWFQVLTTEPVLDLAFSPTSTFANPKLRPQVFLCRPRADPPRDDRVLVRFHGQAIVAAGRCVP